VFQRQPNPRGCLIRRAETPISSTPSLKTSLKTKTNLFAAVAENAKTKNKQTRQTHRRYYRCTTYYTPNTESIHSIASFPSFFQRRDARRERRTRRRELLMALFDILFENPKPTRRRRGKADGEGGHARREE
jgi:hypothetical protein